jgi:hypothetical protein
MGPLGQRSQLILQFLRALLPWPIGVVSEVPAQDVEAFLNVLRSQSTVYL